MRVDAALPERDGAGPSTAAWVRWGVWVGLLTGFTEVALLGVKKFVLHRFIFLGPDVVWMAPLANAGLFAALGLCLGLLVRRWPVPRLQRASVFVIAFPAFLGPLLIFQQLHSYAVLLLVAGLAAQASRIVHAHPGAFDGLVRRSIRGLIAVPVALAIAMSGWTAVRERWAMATLPAPPPEAPNVLLIVLDTVRAEALGLGQATASPAPRLQELARHSVQFERAIATAPWTTPSHASIFTGRFPHETSVDWQTPLDGGHQTLAEVLAAKGYVTGGFVANVEYCGYETGLDRGFAHYEDYATSLTELALSAALGRTIINNHRLRRLLGSYDVPGRKTAEQVNEDFLDWLADRDGRPFFAFLNYWDAHEPYLPPPPFDQRLGSSAARKNHLVVAWGVRQAKRHDKALMSAAEIEAERDAYHGAIAYLDHHLGVLFDTLGRNDLLRNTLVIITADHGEQFGEHGLFDHGNSLYSPLLHVPLLISFPTGLSEATVVRDPVSLRDLPATILDLAGIDDGASFAGESLAPHWARPPIAAGRPADVVLSEVERLPDGPEHYPVSKGTMRSLVSGRFHYILGGDQREELYDLDADPLEKHDLADSPRGQAMLDAFRSRLALQGGVDAPGKDASARVPDRAAPERRAAPGRTRLDASFRAGSDQAPLAGTGVGLNGKPS